jgi:RNA polymerase sigma-70 factor (ECF subfamily)
MIPTVSGGANESPDLALIYERMRRLARRILGHTESLEDVVQTAMEEFVKSRSTFRGEGTIEAFADGILVNVARSWIRKKRTKTALMEVVTDEAEWPDLGSLPAEEAEGWDLFRRLLAIIERLKPDYRIACTLYYLERRSVDEIAAIEGVSSNTIRIRLHRARKDLHARARRDPVLAEWLEQAGAVD